MICRIFMYRTTTLVMSDFTSSKFPNNSRVILSAAPSFSFRIQTCTHKFSTVSNYASLICWTLAVRTCIQRCAFSHINTSFCWLMSSVSNSWMRCSYIWRSTFNSKFTWWPIPMQANVDPVPLSLGPLRIFDWELACSSGTVSIVLSCVAERRHQTEDWIC